MPSFQTNVLKLPPVGGNNFGNFIIIIFFYKERPLFGVPLNAYQTERLQWRAVVALW